MNAASVVANGVNLPNEEETGRMIKEEGGRAIPVVANVTKKSQVEERVNRTLEAFGIDVSPERKEHLLQIIPLGRESNPREDICNAAAFLAPEKASYITGVKFSVGGGINMCLSL